MAFRYSGRADTSMDGRECGDAFLRVRTRRGPRAGKGVMDDAFTRPLSSSASTYPASAGAITVLGPSPKTVPRVSVEADRKLRATAPPRGRHGGADVTSATHTLERMSDPPEFSFC